MPNKSNTSPATLAIIVVTVTSRNAPRRKGILSTNQGTSAKNRYHTRRILGSRLAIKVSSFP